MEAVRLRVKDLDFERGEIVVRDGKGAKDRVSALPQAVYEPLRRHLESMRALHLSDLAEGFGEAYLPFALGSIRTPPSNGPSSTFSRRTCARSTHAIRARESAATTLTRKACSGR
jgi:integrase